VIGPEQALEAGPLGAIGERAPVGPGDPLLSFDHQARPHGASLAAMEPAPDRPYLTELGRGARAAVLGALLGIVLAIAGRRR